MASFIFKRLPKNGYQTRFSIRRSVTNEGLPKKKQLFSDEMMTLHPLAPNMKPSGTDSKAPRLPGDRT